MQQASEQLFAGFGPKELDFLSSLKCPHDIQLFLNSIPYNVEPVCKSPLRVLREKSAHCFEGAIFAACCLRFLGQQPRLVDLGAFNDDDHVLSVFKQNGRFGAVAKSNTTVLRFREPVYLTLRELAMSYFEGYFNTLGFKTLRRFSYPLDLSAFDEKGWMTSEEDLEFIAEGFKTVKYRELLSKDMIRDLAPADPDLIKAGFSCSVEDGLYRADPEAREEV
ncbi:MAG: hypothetical protein PHQ23_09380 [Candidatus Wallbacteria bacterium]|nr:hypothetical protein [Candidatus Wallbacteria bacterium]